jgi:hypothetical protein
VQESFNSEMINIPHSIKLDDFAQLSVYKKHVTELIVKKVLRAHILKALENEGKLLDYQ